MRTILAGASLLALASCATAPPASPAPRDAALDANTCAMLPAEALGRQTVTTLWLPASDGLPAFCEVTATLQPVDGSTIGVVYRLPASWNGKLVGIGGGGWAGNVTLMAARDGLSQGYATMQTDAGHPGTGPWDNAWAVNPEAATDFAHRAIHQMTATGKRVAAALYGRAHDRAYYNGCSTGGRMGLMEAQRYPEDYDAIIAGAPVYTLQVQTTGLLRNQTFAAGDGAGGFTPADLHLVQTAVLAQCDADDGLADGLVSDPATCAFQPRTLQCAAGQSDGCLSPPQVTALQAVYDGRRAADGSWMMFPLYRGGEAGWSMFIGTDGTGSDATGGGGLTGLQPVIFGARAPDWANFTETDYMTVRRSAFASLYEADDPDLSAFFARGGKLLTWFGLSDPGPSPVIGTDYAHAVAAANPEAGESFRHFTLPGVGHCRGGPGADNVNWLDVMDRWVESGIAPDRVTGSNTQNPALVRPHCAWPAVASYRGSGDANDPANWICRARS
ncbi:tannase/feruloyl esterase family alpha/beta hydrolase [Erythrobacter arachoides]|uniref:Tannase/feruloyl esterase family alpha/beta hydrolase n=1 Tax=Aurantiacibacter arachoides TaxID=1850444 RepID=A0A845A0L2_9SPHN|nr:tannase/feruloyl esterase family alpha/beta hydrolase [Aurantiacibacter arachoides]MXO93488.1 tannase/feruloyl esterase family alpha/beta hydrolase [Aurantiacibacter arachoides]GGD48982.1 hypothetical protein GCM10011411_05940 [Aurantiacibacter arachoides]